MPRPAPGQRGGCGLGVDCGQGHRALQVSNPFSRISTPTAAGFATGMAEGGCRSSISCPCPLDDAGGWPTLSASISEWLDSGCVPGLSAVGEGKRQTPSPSSLLVTSPPFTLRHDWWPAGESALGEEVLAGWQGGGAGQPDNWFFQCLTY